MVRFANKVDMTFSYTVAASTDIRKTIARHRKRIAEEKARSDAQAQAAAAQAEAEVTAKVRQIKSKP